MKSQKKRKVRGGKKKTKQTNKRRKTRNINSSCDTNKQLKKKQQIQQ